MWIYCKCFYHKNALNLRKEVIFNDQEWSQVYWMYNFSKIYSRTGNLNRVQSVHSHWTQLANSFAFLLLISLSNGISTFIGYLMPKPFF